MFKLLWSLACLAPGVAVGVQAGWALGLTVVVVQAIICFIGHTIFLELTDKVFGGASPRTTGTFSLLANVVVGYGLFVLATRPDIQERFRAALDSL